MSLPVFIHPSLEHVGPDDEVRLEGPEGRHAVTVKRIGVGEAIELIDGTGRVASCTVTATSGKDSLAARAERVHLTPAPEPRVVVVQAIPKSERAELAVDLATQAGADAVIAWQADRCVAKWDAKKAPKALSKWEAAAVAAAKQSRRQRIPEVSGPMNTAQLCEHLAAQDPGSTTVLVLHEEATESLKELAVEALSGTVYVVVGPEGGIGAAELGALRDVGARPIKLGPEVLRTASAAMVALAGIGMRTARW